MVQNKEIQVNCDTEYEQIIETIKRTMKGPWEKPPSQVSTNQEKTIK